MPVVTIRPAEPEDVPQILDLLGQVNLPTADLAGAPWDHFFVAVSDLGIVGVVGLEPAIPFALLRSLGVTPMLQRTGLGQRLLNRAEQRATEIGVRQLGLITDNATAYFARQGYRPVTRADAPSELTNTRQFREICPNSATVMLKSTG